MIGNIGKEWSAQCDLGFTGPFSFQDIGSIPSTQEKGIPLSLIVNNMADDDLAT